MNFGDLEQEICDRIVTKVGDGVIVMPIPEKESDFKIPVEKSKITVSYKSSDFNQLGGKGSSYETQSVSSSIQNELITFSVMVQARTLRGNNGVYELLRLVRSALVGLQLSSTDKLKLSGSGFFDYAESLHSYELNVSAMTISIEEEEPFDFDAVIAPAVTQIVIDGNLNTSIVPPDELPQSLPLTV